MANATSIVNILGIIRFPNQDELDACNYWKPIISIGDDPTEQSFQKQGEISNPTVSTNYGQIGFIVRERTVHTKFTTARDVVQSHTCVRMNSQRGGEGKKKQTNFT